MSETDTKTPVDAATACSGLVRDYVNATAKLDAYRLATFRRGGFVRVDCPRYRGFGIVATQGDAPANQLAVLLENNNIWWYPIESVEPVSDLKAVPRSVRRRRLQSKGYQLTGCR